jgi:uncharacterized protein YerC
MHNGTSNPLSEARQMLHFVERGEPIEKIRAQIGSGDPYRRQTLLLFDTLRIRNKSGPLSRELCAEILRLLSTGLTQVQVAQKIGICWLRISRVAQAAEASSWRTRGRRLSRGEREGIGEAIRQGERPKKILDTFRVSRMTLHRMRGELGDRKNWQHMRALTDSQADEIRAELAKGTMYKELATRYGVCVSVIGNVKRRIHGY